MRKLMNLKGVKKLKKAQQRGINGGRLQCFVRGRCISFGRQCAELRCALVAIGPC